MDKPDVTKLSELARISLDDVSVDKIDSQIGSILDYVGQLQQLAETVDAASDTEIGYIKNIMRADEAKSDPTERASVIKAFPKDKGDHLVVKKILG